MKRLILIAVIFIFAHISVVIGDIVVDEFNSTEGWYPVASSNASASLKSTSGYSGNGLKIVASFNKSSDESDWCAFYKQFKYMDLSQGDRLRFYYKYTGSAASLYFNINGVEKFIVNLSTMYSFDTGIVNLDSFEGVDLSKVEKIKFVVKDAAAGDKGTLLLTKLELFRSSDIPESLVTLDDFSDNDDSNTLLGSVQLFYKAPASCDHNVVATNSSLDYMTLHYTKGSTAADTVKWIMKISGSQYTNLSDYDYVKFKIKANKSNVNIGIVLQDTGYNGVLYKVNSTEDNFYNQWQEIIIPIEYFKNINLKSVGEFQFAFYDDSNILTNSESFYINIDDIKFYRSFKSAGLVKTVDSMDYYNSKSPWVKYGDLDNSVAISSGDGIAEYTRSVKFDFTFNSGSFVLIERQFFLNMAKGFLEFKIKTSGDNNNLKVQIASEDDNNKVVFYRTFYRLIGNTSDWITLKLKPEDWRFCYSVPDNMSNPSIDLKKITQLEFVITKNEDCVNSECIIDDLKLVDEDEYYFIHHSNRLIENFSVDDMQFSPDGDGDNDTIVFTFGLKERAKVDLFIFNIKGELVRTIFSYNYGKYYDAGQYSIVWDGKDDNGKILNNGIYLFKFKAESTTSKDSVKKIVAIKR